ncbi:YicC/YloC family endoribonuclease [Pseudomarimonas salicorniae]|uniref:YicC family protein n=1 Tax=Pseudomarimonas salicorniae TaxID=2933270 RepID=A0ABT0GIW8_9GAMM|nr:YicC/YloC family endoribonuclease [Lysobacter sp. CAU 1642]MCK7594488.1 YicC family protein [Lysobacter sp. CAU 1642]
MIRSMTAYASVERATPWGTLSAEMRAVNHRYLELSLRAPEELRAAEPAVRDKVAQRLQRGKVELGLRFRANAGGEMALNTDMLDRLGHMAIEAHKRFPQLKVEFAQLLQFPGVLQRGEVDPTALQAETLLAVDELLSAFTEARQREGEKLAALMIERLDAMEAQLAQMRAWLPEIRQTLEQRLRDKLSALREAADNGRLEQELVLGLSKIDVDEELDRLGVHIAEARRVLKLSEPVGRRLDFLMQEFNREANTLGSKSIDARTTQVAVELKVLIEQLREQVQNIE